MKAAINSTSISISNCLAPAILLAKALALWPLDIFLSEFDTTQGCALNHRLTFATNRTLLICQFYSNSAISQLDSFNPVLSELLWPTEHERTIDGMIASTTRTASDIYQRRALLSWSQHHSSQQIIARFGKPAERNTFSKVSRFYAKDWDGDEIWIYNFGDYSLHLLLSGHRVTRWIEWDMSL